MSDSFPALLGIRHHGPGSARSVRETLERLKPDLILLEGPPDAQDLLRLAAHPAMQPPVALLIYASEAPRRAAYYPFAVFSPEWQAILYGLNQAVPVRFMDLPQTHRLALSSVETDAANHRLSDYASIRQDPLRWVADAAGFDDGERWWEHMVESRRDSGDLFQGILELMTALRNEAAGSESADLRLEAQREAWMRRTLRQAQKEDFRRIAVVCGAWHVPALTDSPPVKEDNLLLKGLPKIKVRATWTPWTYDRLSYQSGYGAGIESPGYYHHLWNHPDEITVQWMTRIARLLRAQDLGASTASVIDAVRLAEALASLRERPLPALSDLNEAARAVFCSGDEAPMQLIAEQLVVGERLGEVPEETPNLPLEQDLQSLQKRLRLPPQAGRKTLELDLRKPNDLQRSHLLHRLRLLEIPWGAQERAGGKGTFRESWRLQWRPELAIAVIEASVWGNTVVEAASARVCDAARNAEQLGELTRLLQHTLLADLPEAVGELMSRLQNAAALSSDLPHLMDALPPLAEVLRYGNVRKTDTDSIGHVVAGLATRICIGLPAACGALNDEAAQEMLERLQAVNNAITLLQDDKLLEPWRAVLAKLLDQQNLHGLLAGRCCRLLFDQDCLETEETARHMRLALSAAAEPAQAAAWIEGFLQGSGLILLHNEALWRILDQWAMAIKEEVFVQLLPLLRRTFASFPAPERRQMGERVKRGPMQTTQVQSDIGEGEFDVERADLVLPLVANLLGLNLDLGRYEP